jgi:hypothetical protein
MRTLTVVTEIEVNDEPIEVTIEAEFIPGMPGRRYMPNGDPGYPDEPDEINILSVLDSNGKSYQPTRHELTRIEDLISSEAGSFEPDYD